jgi:hypothetical protein
LDFGLDAQALSELIGGDKQWAENIIDAFGSTNGMCVAPLLRSISRFLPPFD